VAVWAVAAGAEAAAASAAAALPDVGRSER
jgi:hypothetical protein